MSWNVRLLAVGLIAVLVLPASLLGVAGVSTAVAPTVTATAPPSTGAVVQVVNSTPVASVAPTAVPAATTPSASITIVNASFAKHISWSFWGINVAAQQTFKTSDASNIAATPVDFIRFPGGDVGEQYNYTSGIITNNNGATQHAGTSVSQFVTSCESISCHAIMQLPAEIDQPYTAAYYANYVVHTLNFQPAYWEIGNAVPGWTHFDQPWSAWSSASSQHITADGFAAEVGQYITAIKAVDKGAHFIAFGSAMGTPDYAKVWISELALVDGKNLSGISVHSYVMGAAPANPTWSDLLSNLNGKYSMVDQVTADRSYLTANCPKCNLKLFITEANGAEVNNYTQLLPSFAGDLYLAADVVYGLNLRLTNIDWFCYASNYGGAWDNGGTWQMQYTLFTQMFSELGHSTLATAVSGPSSFYAAATYSKSTGLALLMVNANITSKVSVNLGATGILLGAAGDLRQWANGSTGPKNSTLTLGTTLTLPALSISVLRVAPLGLGVGASPSQVHHLNRSSTRSSAPQPSPAPVAGNGVAPTPPSSGTGHGLPTPGPGPSHPLVPAASLTLVARTPA